MIIDSGNCLKRAFKRAIDIAGSLTGLILLSPFLLGITLIVRLVDGSPVFYLQQRPGIRGKPFTIIKFRTMKAGQAGSNLSEPDDRRLTRLGRILREYSLDELPELLNVLKGDMSLVGPRPLLMEYLPLYSVEQARRHDVKPGITGWAQVNGRNELDWEDRFAFDLYYVDRNSTALDLKILLMTVGTVFRREGIGSQGSATMSHFEGAG